MSEINFWLERSGISIMLFGAVRNIAKSAIFFILCLALISCSRQSTFEKACETFQNGNIDATISAFAELYRENADYLDLLSSAKAIKDYEVELESQSRQRKNSVGGSQVLIYDVGNLEESAKKANAHIKTVCS